MEKHEFVQLYSQLYDFALIPAHCSTAFARSGICPYDPCAIKNRRIIKNNLSTTVSSSKQSIQTLSNELDSSLRSNNESIIQRNRLARSN
ncbi:unnamed protein product [Rotaria sordida]|uniref:Uncharacterized protein n=1 Tax=Rotaria sordida TaxID=392033 RepID=A0A813S460_9BILA|nr:unnamed protein product [Rotaria sordida]CAF0793845.1 unnamed protein product [Rotaria sordida]CAF3719324.1 unnamed protein product [Rotaria sordida]